MSEMISWRELVSTVHLQLIQANIKLVNASVGEFEFGGLQVTQKIVCSVNPETAALLILDKDCLPNGKINGTYNGKAGLDWLTFANHIESLCIDNGILPSEVCIDHLEVRGINSVSDLSIYVDTKFKTLSITDIGQRINGTSLSDI